MTRTATSLMFEAWEQGIEDKNNPFDESIEQMWIRQWLFYSNSVRFASAMGSADPASFKNGWWFLTENIQHMKDLINLKHNGKEED